MGTPPFSTVLPGIPPACMGGGGGTGAEQPPPRRAGRAGGGAGWNDARPTGELFERRQAGASQSPGDLVTRAESYEGGDIACCGEEPVLARQHVDHRTCFARKRGEGDVQDFRQRKWWHITTHSFAGRN